MRRAPLLLALVLALPASAGQRYTPPGGGTVIRDATLTGDGSVGSPLGVELDFPSALNLLDVLTALSIVSGSGLDLTITAPTPGNLHLRGRQLTIGTNDTVMQTFNITATYGIEDVLVFSRLFKGDLTYGDGSVTPIMRGATPGKLGVVYRSNEADGNAITWQTFLGVNSAWVDPAGVLTATAADSNELTADKIRYGNQTTVNFTADPFNVTWPTPMPDADYGVGGCYVDTDPSTAGSPLPLAAFNRTASGCTISLGGIAPLTSLDIVLWPIGKAVP